ncbi:hypothetical protein [Paenibacillus rhizoplanae]|uniref:hypothetical protein n=1 Tax=Paenibacillus rhizoplanae TaxID=1917181 RepID=UPI003617ACBD
MVMNSKSTRNILLVTALAAVSVLSACGGGNDKNNNAGSSTNGGTAGSTDKEVTLRLFSNLPDRKSGQGLAEQMVIDNYIKANPNVKIDIETLPRSRSKIN